MLCMYLVTYIIHTATREAPGRIHPEPWVRVPVYMLLYGAESPRNQVTRSGQGPDFLNSRLI